jgi:hypothetical protein
MGNLKAKIGWTIVGLLLGLMISKKFMPQPCQHGHGISQAGQNNEKITGQVMADVLITTEPIVNDTILDNKSLMTAKISTDYMHHSIIDAKHKKWLANKKISRDIDGGTILHWNDLHIEENSSSLPLSVYNTAQISPKKSENNKGTDLWDWTAFISGPKKALEQIECVTYHLHPTFKDPDVKICGSKNDPNFRLATTGWGTFSIPVEIHMKDGSIQKLEHQLVFQNTIFLTKD